jgi:uncharacterized protein (TIGR00369 family)
MKKQPNSQMCFVCGLGNPIGLRAAFYEDAAGRVTAKFTPRPEHQGFPGIMHGGIITALLDETLSRVAIAAGRWVVTGRLNVRFRRPIPVEEPLTIIGEAVKWNGRMLEARGEIRLADGRVGAEATGTFLEIPSDQVEGMEEALAFWRVVPDPE